MEKKENNKNENRIIKQLSNLYLVLFKPAIFFKKNNSNNNVKDTIIYACFISTLFYLFYLFKIILQFKNYELPNSLNHFINIFTTPLSVWHFIFFISIELFIILIILILSVIISWIIQMIIQKKEYALPFIQIWKITIFSFTPLIIDQIVNLILYLIKLPIPYTSYLIYAYIIWLIIFGIRQVK